MKTLKNIIVGLILVAGISACHTARAIEPLFPEDSEQVDDSFTESVELPEDAVGRVTGIDGTQWTKGADGHYRSDGEDCVFSKPVEKFICSK